MLESPKDMEAEGGLVSKGISQMVDCRPFVSTGMDLNPLVIAQAAFNAKATMAELNDLVGNYNLDVKCSSFMNSAGGPSTAYFEAAMDLDPNQYGKTAVQNDAILAGRNKVVDMNNLNVGVGACGISAGTCTAKFAAESVSIEKEKMKTAQRTQVVRDNATTMNLSSITQFPPFVKQVKHKGVDWIMNMPVSSKETSFIGSVKQMPAGSATQADANLHGTSNRAATIASGSWNKAWSRVDYVKIDSMMVDINTLGDDNSVSADLEAVNANLAKLEKALVGKVSGKKLLYDELNDELQRKWSWFGEFQVVVVDEDCFICIFDKPEARDAVLMGGPWFIAGHIIGMDRWKPSFSPNSMRGLSLPIWVRFLHLPLLYWDNSNIARFASKIGQPLWVDGETNVWGRSSYARVCIHIDLSRKLPSGVWVHGLNEEFFQPVEYEGLSQLCFRCGVMGHKAAHCMSSEGQLPACSMHDKAKEQQQFKAENSTSPHVNNVQSVPSKGIVVGIAAHGMEEQVGGLGSELGLLKSHGEEITYSTLNTGLKGGADVDNCMQEAALHDDIHGALGGQPLGVEENNMKDADDSKEGLAGCDNSQDNGYDIHWILVSRRKPRTPGFGTSKNEVNRKHNTNALYLNSDTAPPAKGREEAGDAGQSSAGGEFGTSSIDMEGLIPSSLQPLVSSVGKSTLSSPPNSKKSSSKKSREGKGRISKAHFDKEVQQLGPVVPLSRKKRKSCNEATDGGSSSPSLP